MEKHCFADANGREWECAITVGVIRKVRQKLSLNLANAFDHDAKKGEAGCLERLSEDPVLLVDTLYCICEEQANSRGVSDVQFGELFCTGEIIEAATLALLNGLLRFLPPTKRLVMDKILQIANRSMEQLVEEGRKELEKPEVQAEIAEVWRRQFANTRESSE